MNKIINLRKFNGNIKYLIVSLILVVVAVFVQKYELQPDGYQVDTEEFSQILYEKEDDIGVRLKEVFNKCSIFIDSSEVNLFEVNKNLNFEELRAKGFTIAIFLNDSLRFWTDNAIKIEKQYSKTQLNNNVVKLNNAWYLVKHIHSKNIDAIGLVLIKHKYSFENDYLSNAFHADFNQPSSIKISLISLSYSFDISDRQGNYLFSLVPVNTISSKSIHWQLIGILYFLSIAFMLLFITKWFRQLSTQQVYPTRLILFVILSVLFFRYLMLEFKYPFHIYSLDFFDPQYFAVSYFYPSLGDFLINAMLILFFVISFFILFRKGRFVRKMGKKSNLVKYLSGFAFFILLISFFHIIVNYIESLVLNSSLTLDAYKVLEFSVLSLISYFVIAILIIALIILVDYIFFIGKHLFKKRYFVIVFLFALSFFYVFALILNVDVSIKSIPFLLSLLPLFFYIHYGAKKYHYSFYIVIIFISSIYVVLFTSETMKIKEQDKAKVLISKLQTERDLVVEHLLINLEQKISEDKPLEKLINNPSNEKSEMVSDYLLKKYFKGYFKKYDLDIRICSNHNNIKSSNQLEDCAKYYGKQVVDYGKKLKKSNFYYLDNHNGRLSYLGSVNYDVEQTSYTLYLILDSKLITSEIGYPDLLIEGNIKNKNSLSEYSYAKYSENELKTRFGNFPYDLNDKMFDGSKSGYTFLALNNFDHIVYKPSKDNLIVLSKPSVKSLDLVIAFSYVFLFFNIILLISLSVNNLPSLINLAQLNIENKLLMSMIFVLALSFIMVGAGTVYYNIQQFGIKNDKNISEKLESVLKGLELEIIDVNVEDSTLQTVDVQKLNDLLRKQADVFYTDINLYDFQGGLIASSRPEIFTKGLIGDFMDPEAYKQMEINEKVRYIHQENVSSLEYTSAYALLRDADNKKLAYINLPHFTEPGTLQKEISNLIVAVINLYVVLFIIIAAVSFFMSNKITQPLRMLQNKFMGVELGKQSEQISYNKKDEIGALVTEYNNMVIKLAENIELLAKTERESAWREMAKQVAHEIKNPLTPMKLSVQFLQRSWQDQDDNFEKKLDKYTQALIDQINTLSNIANEFSSFAKMPKPQNELVNLVEKLENTINLFSHDENIELISNFKNNKVINIIADKEQISRVFNNLIKNAIQAVPSDRKGKISVNLKKENGFALVKIKDNGGGISEEEKEKLFIPNFTTKSTGMGMGLPIVKEIIENAKGEIWFESTINKGTTFFIKLPEAMPNENGNYLGM
ncbi:MAG: ATP-binding protein [Bacteroidota bacterium]